MTYDYIGSRDAVAAALGRLSATSAPMIVVDACTANHEQLRDTAFRAIEASANEHAVLITPLHVNSPIRTPRIRYRAAIEAFESEMREMLASITVVRCSRLVEDLAPDLRSATRFGVLCHVADLTEQPLLTATDVAAAVHGAAGREPAPVPRPWAVSGPMISMTELASRCTTESGGGVVTQAMSSRELAALIVDSGVSTVAAERIVDAQRLAALGVLAVDDTTELLGRAPADPWENLALVLTDQEEQLR